MARVLHPYQERGIALIGNEISHGRKAVCFVMPTGTGKTATLAEVCRRHLAKVTPARVLWMVHREELVTDAFDELESLGLSCGVIMATPSRIVNPYRQVQVASVQTMIARKIFVDGITLCVHDEAHHGPSKSWIALPNHYKSKGAVVIGPTATPIRGDGIGLGDIYDAIVQPITTAEAIAQGYLCPYDMVRAPYALKNDQIAQSPVDAYKTYANGEKAIVFAPHIIAAEAYLEEFTNAGIPAVFVHGKTDSTTRRAKLDEYKSGKARVLVNVGIATEGFNDPSTACIILARSIGSVGLYLQILGRGLRTAANKTRLIIVDLHGSSHIHGTPEADADGNERVWQLEGDALCKKAKEPNPQTFCKICGMSLEGATICDLCGELRPDLLPPEVVNVKLIKYAAKLREDPTQRAQYLVKLIKLGRSKGYKYGAAFAKYGAIYGVPPSNEIQTMARSILNIRAEGAID